MKKGTAHGMVRSLIACVALCLIAYAISAQETKLELPTNDNTSSFNVTKNNGTSIFKVDGSGRMTGDGSGLSYVRPVIACKKGNHWDAVTKNYGYYQNIRQVTIEVPCTGVIWTQATGTLRWESKGWDLILCSILRNSDPNETWSAENEFYNNLMLLTDYNCADSSDQHTGFSCQNMFTVGAGTHTLTLWGNKYTSSAKVSVMDISMVAMFFPTSGTGKEAIREEEYEVKPGPGPSTPDF